MRVTNIRGWLAAAAAAGVLTQVSVQVLPERPGVVVASVPLVLAAYAVHGHLRQARAVRGRMRAGWIVAAVASALWSLANALYLADAAVGRRAGRAEPAGGHQPGGRGPGTRRAAAVHARARQPAVRVRRAIDGMIVAGAFFLVAWQLVLRDVLAVVDPRVYPLVLGFPGFELVCAAVAVVLLSRSLGSGYNALSLLAVSMLIFTVNLGYIANLVHGHPAYGAGAGAGYTFATAHGPRQPVRGAAAGHDRVQEHGSSRWGCCRTCRSPSPSAPPRSCTLRGPVPGTTKMCGCCWAPRAWSCSASC